MAVEPGNVSISDFEDEGAPIRRMEVDVDYTAVNAEDEQPGYSIYWQIPADYELEQFETAILRSPDISESSPARAAFWTEEARVKRVNRRLGDLLDDARYPEQCAALTASTNDYHVTWGVTAPDLELDGITVLADSYQVDPFVYYFEESVGDQTDAGSVAETVDLVYRFLDGEIDRPEEI